MDVYYQPKAVKNLEAKLADIRGRGSQRLAQSIAKALVDGNTYDRLNARTKDGQGIAPLTSRRKGKYKGATGPALAPFGAASRVVANFKAKLRRSGAGWQVVAGWSGVTGRGGTPFLPFHDAGAGHNPRRPIFGISPKTRAEIRRLLKLFAAGAFQKTGFRG